MADNKKEDKLKLDRVMVLKVPILPSTIIFVPPMTFALNVSISSFLILTFILMFGAKPFVLFILLINHGILVFIMSNQPHLETLIRCKLDILLKSRIIPNIKINEKGLNP